MNSILDLTHSLAYIDGGSASMFFQALIGGLLALSIMIPNQLKMLWARLKPSPRKQENDIH